MISPNFIRDMCIEMYGILEAMENRIDNLAMAVAAECPTYANNFCQVKIEYGITPNPQPPVPPTTVSVVKVDPETYTGFLP